MSQLTSFNSCHALLEWLQWRSEDVYPVWDAERIIGEETVGWSYPMVLCGQCWRGTWLEDWLVRYPCPERVFLWLFIAHVFSWGNTGLYIENQLSTLAANNDGNLITVYLHIWKIHYYENCIKGQTQVGNKCHFKEMNEDKSCSDWVFIYNFQAAEIPGYLQITQPCGSTTRQTEAS